MRKVINPCRCEVYSKITPIVNAFVEIKFKDGNLSIHGVVGPMNNGNCKGSCGQCIDEIREGKPTGDWTDEMLQKLCDIWDRWHLNDMRPYCEHQKALGWDEQSKEEVKIETWTLTRDALQIKKAAERRALECLKNGQLFYPTKDEVAYARMEYSMKAYNGEDISYYHGKLYRDSYELKAKDCLGHSNTEYKERGWISYNDHPLGFIGRPCPVCGYKYGHGLIKEEVPQEIIDWLFSLQETKIQPAWV